MPNKHHESLVLVTNPNSTRAAAVEKDVIQPLIENGIDFTRVETRFKDRNDNVRDLIDRLPSDGRRAVIATGDGGVEQSIEAIHQGQKDLEIALLPYGNFNDMATAHKEKSHTVLDMINAPTLDVHPMTIDVNGEFWRTAPAYVTLGLTARIAAGFDSPESREKMKASNRAERTVRRLGQAVGDYFKYSRQALPAFRMNDGEIIDDSTDVAASNNTVAAGMIRVQDSYYDTPYFGARADLNMRNVFEAAHFGTLSLTGYSPLERMQAMRLSFEQASSIPVQTSGEFEQLEDVTEIFIYKDPKNAIKIAHSKLT